MRAETLGAMVTRLRAETGQSLSVALGVNARDTLVVNLQGAQEELYLEHEWPFLRHTETVTLAAGEFEVSIPATLNPDRINRVYARELAATDAEWGAPLIFADDPGIRAPGEGDVTGTLPQLWWRKLDADTNQLFLTVAPRSDVDVQIKISGIMPLRPFVEAEDRSTLDAKLIVMAAASEILARQKSADAPVKQARMVAYLRKILGVAAPYHRRVMIGGGGTPYGGGVSARRRLRVRGVD